MAALAQLTPTPRLLLGPGPCDAHPRVLTAMTTPLLGHLDPQYLQYMDETAELLRFVYQTSNTATLPVPGTGSAGMECCFANLLEEGDTIVVAAAGYFGHRMLEMARRQRATVVALTKPWGQTFTLAELNAALEQHKPKVLAIVHAETSTGAWQQLDGLGALCHEHGALLLTDCVTSLGCVPVNVDAWGIDAAYSCSQKGLGCPPGLAPVTFSPRAMASIAVRKAPCQSWYLDITLLLQYWGQERVYHHTGPISLTYALREGLRIVQEEGLEARFARHLLHHRALCAGLEALGLKYIAAEGERLPQLNAVMLPEGVDDLTYRKQLLIEFGIEVGGGLGESKGKAWRIGLMGYNSRRSSVAAVLFAIEQVLHRAGVKLTPGAGLAAAEAIYSAN
jgi:alanine-glyoxylate transaminase/serine-glyoxylate transaminase/serine-pyruvate transaminase